MSEGETRYSSNSFNAAFSARSHAVSFSPARCLSLTPTLLYTFSTSHSGNSLTSSSFVRTFSGR